MADMRDSRVFKKDKLIGVKLIGVRHQLTLDGKKRELMGV